MDDELLRVIKQQGQAIEALLRERQGMEKKALVGAHTATPLHGTGGIFAVSGLERDIITAHVRPRGISKVLPLIPSVLESPIFGSLTGYTATTGTQPTSACDDAPQGYVKGCNLTAAFGLKRFDTQEIEMDKVMLKINRGDFTDLVLRGRVLGLTDLVPSGLNESQILNIVTMSEMVIAGVNMERALNTDIWTGTVAAGSFPGLDYQIATGQVDATTNTACPALDSDVKDFDYDNVCGTGRDIVEYLGMLAYYLQWNAESMGLDPVQWVVVMRPQLWQELTECWPCRYNTDRCSTSTSSTSGTVVLGDQMIAQRDAMRNSMMLKINGMEYPVVLDTGIFEHNNINNGNLIAGQYASSIYMVPLTIVGGFPVTYREYVDYRQANTDRQLLRGMEDWFWTDNGAFSWAIQQQLWCYKLGLKTEQRVVLRTPQLAGKIDNVMYEPLQHVREPDPDSPYHYDGGVSLRGGSTLYHVWS